MADNNDKLVNVLEKLERTLNDFNGMTSGFTEKGGTGGENADIARIVSAYSSQKSGGFGKEMVRIVLVTSDLETDFGGKY